MPSRKTYTVAQHSFSILGDTLCNAIVPFDGLVPFETPHATPLFTFSEGATIPILHTAQYTFHFEDVTGTFGTTADGYQLTLKPSHEPPLTLWCSRDSATVMLHGNYSLRLLRFALWIGYGLMTLSYDTIAIHSSCIAYQDKAILFLGESGTGKSTHTRLWCQHIVGATLLNDDSPILRIENNQLWVYGSPWSGKTPCYKPERRSVAACVRLSQAPHNQLSKLPTLQAYGALHPSCPPQFAYDNDLYDMVSHTIGQILTATPCYHLACLPNAEAAHLVFGTIFTSPS
ncbi:MAG: hypothetical protein II278_10245 [Bacteroidaceae bacterium]|nr:hypothetical protein [Bacteroidaceae bacterium]